MFEASEIKRLIEAALPGTQANVIDDAGDKEHFTAEVVSPAFEGLNRVRRHQAIYAALGKRVGNEIHALAITKALTPAEAAEPGRR